MVGGKKLKSISVSPHLLERVDPLRYVLLYLFCGTNAHRKFCYIFMPAGFGMPSKKMDEQKPECSMVFP
jgi:hypothetical protein